ncbi:MAG TPA: aminomethyl-transferring glycine dehydrogenase subunit GcvPA [Clostridia bacterium]|nr:aminomethyl-transferring glycine dehydrogenase subunit GcvPA [Clostridia bacterium]
MGSYIPSTEQERQEMLAALGMTSTAELYRDIPDEVLLKTPLNLPDGMSEMEVRAAMQALADKNKNYKTILRGAGAYDHYIPSIVKYIPAKEEFLTSYTPYQAEMSQGILQSIFEYQTMICELTGMDVSNASVYDGACAAAEAAAMCRDRKRNITLISESAHPDVINTVKTYCYGANMPFAIVPMKDGKTDIDALKGMLNGQTASFYIQQPNFCGLFEDAEVIAETVHEAGAMFVMGVNPIALGIMKTPRDCGADVAVGEGQPLGIPLSFGGPYIGFMSTTDKNMRKLPGRIVGQTVDHEGRTAYVLTLQAREQHIRREKASSNICSNEALCALTVSAYLSVMGSEGIKKVAVSCMSKAHYLADKLTKIPGVRLAHKGEFFHEFLTTMPVCSCKVMEALDKEGILGGLPTDYGVLWCVTEKTSRAMLDRTAKIVKEVCENEACV